MSVHRMITLGALGLSAIVAAPALAQAEGEVGASFAGSAETIDIPAGYENAPSHVLADSAPTEGEVVETITRTRWIERGGPVDAHSTRSPAPTVAQRAVASYPVMLEREAWLAECEARTRAGQRRRKSRNIYDCSAALDRYLGGASYSAVSYPVHAPCACGEPTTMIALREEIPQRVVEREVVSEEWVEVPPAPREPAARVVEQPIRQPASGKLIKGS